MTLHYHCTPITPRTPVLYSLAGRNFCVSYAAPGDVKVCHEIGQSVLLDNGAFTFWVRGAAGSVASAASILWENFFDWAEPWLDYPTTWVVIPDVIDGTEEQNDRLLVQWWQRRLPKGAPVWHMHESIDRLKRLCHGYERVCVGSSGRYSQPGSEMWHRRMTEAMNELCGSGPVPVWLHMLRGMSLSEDIYPFASVDSSDIARNHYLERNNAVKMADRWDALQCPARWVYVPLTPELELVNEL